MLNVSAPRWSCSIFFGLLLFAATPLVRADGANLANHRPATQSSRSRFSTATDPQGAVDGTKNGSYGFHTESQANPWWQVDLGAEVALSEVRIFNRLDCCAERARTLRVLLSSDGGNFVEAFANNGTVFGGATDGRPLRVQLGGRRARYVRVQLAETSYLHLDEVEVYGLDPGR